MRIFSSLLLFSFLLLLNSVNTQAQKVGVVLSGGGADGVAHIGVLKALEENHIPIDYIVGTSMGAFIAGMYASGYSVAEIEKFIKSEKFKRAAEGDVEEKYIFYLKDESCKNLLCSLLFCTVFLLCSGSVVTSSDSVLTEL